MNIKKILAGIALLIIAAKMDIPVQVGVDNYASVSRGKVDVHTGLTRDYISTLLSDAQNAVFDSSKIEIAKKITSKCLKSDDPEDRREGYFALKKIRSGMVFDSSKAQIQELMEKLV